MPLADTARLAVELSLKGDLVPKTAQARKAIGQLEKQVSKTSKTTEGLRKSLISPGLKKSILQGVGLGAGLAGFTLLSAGIGKTVDIVGDAIGAASDLEESQSKVEQVFTRSSRTIRTWASDSARSLGISEQAALEAAGTFGNFIQALGNTESQANEMSRTMVQLAADLASFNNTGIEETIIALRSGLAGEVEPLRRLGVSISAARVEALLLAQGVKKVGGAFRDADKVAARYQIIMEDTAKAQGDFARTSDGLANSQRIVDAQLQNASASLGKALLPAAKLATEAMQGLAETLLHISGEGGRSGLLDDLITDLRDVEKGLRDTADATEEAEGQWAGTGTVLDSLIDGVHALNEATDPYLQQVRALSDELRPLARDFGLTSDDIGAFARATIDAGLSTEDAKRRLTGFISDVRMETRLAAKDEALFRQRSMEAAAATDALSTSVAHTDTRLGALDEALRKTRLSTIGLTGAAKRVDLSALDDAFSPRDLLRDTAKGLRQANREIEAAIADPSTIRGPLRRIAQLRQRLLGNLTRAQEVKGAAGKFITIFATQALNDLDKTERDWRAQGDALGIPFRRGFLSGSKTSTSQLAAALIPAEANRKFEQVGNRLAASLIRGFKSGLSGTSFGPPGASQRGSGPRLHGGGVARADHTSIIKQGEALLTPANDTLVLSPSQTRMRQQPTVLRVPVTIAAYEVNRQTTKIVATNRRLAS